MAWRVSWTETAWLDLEGIAAFIARDSEYFMTSFVRQARDIARSLRTLPHRGRIVPEFGNETIRELSFSGYRLIYQTDDQAVHILAIIHGARDLSALWKQEHRDLPS